MWTHTTMTRRCVYDLHLCVFLGPLCVQLVPRIVSRAVIEVSLWWRRLDISKLPVHCFKQGSKWSLDQIIAGKESRASAGDTRESVVFTHGMTYLSPIPLVSIEWPQVNHHLLPPAVLPRSSSPGSATSVISSPIPLMRHRHKFMSLSWMCSLLRAVTSLGLSLYVSHIWVNPKADVLHYMYIYCSSFPSSPSPPVCVCGDTKRMAAKGCRSRNSSPEVKVQRLPPRRGEIKRRILGSLLGVIRSCFRGGASSSGAIF